MSSPIALHLISLCLMKRLGTSSGRHDGNPGLGDKESGREREREGGRDREIERGIQRQRWDVLSPHASRSMLAITPNHSGVAIAQAVSVKLVITG